MRRCRRGTHQPDASGATPTAAFQRRLKPTLAAAIVALLVVIGFGSGAGADPVPGPVITAGAVLTAVTTDETLHRVYVSDRETNTLLAIDGKTNAVAGSLPLPARISAPYELASDPQSHRVYVTTDDALLVVDGPTMKIVGSIAGGGNLREPRTMPGSGRVYALRAVETTNGSQVFLV